jgi:uncharacterized protein
VTQPPPPPWPPPQSLAPPPAMPPPPSPQQQSHPHPEPRSYPLMLRTWDYQWWKPVVGLLVGVIVFFGVQFALAAMLYVVAIAEGGSKPVGDRFEDLAALDHVTPWTMLYLNLGLASLTLVTWFVVRVVHGMRPRWLASVKPGIRWKFLAACVGLAVVALLVSFVVGAFLPGDANGTTGHAHFPTGQLLVTAIVILVTTPLQALGEEYGFRGYLMQAFGSFTGSRVAALLISSGLFALAHGTQNWPLFLNRLGFGLTAGLLVLIVGGLEAGIAFHVVNNLVAFGIAVVLDQLDSTLSVSDASWWSLVPTLVQYALFLGLATLVARRMGLRSTTTPPVAS